MRKPPLEGEVIKRLDELADAALARAGGGVLSESDATPSAEFLYTETHLAIQLYFLNRLGQRPDGLAEAARRLRVWDAAAVHPTFFNSMATSLLGIWLREQELKDGDLARAISSIQQRRSDNAGIAWGMWCGNNMYVQQLATDLLFAPLCDGREVSANSGDRLDQAFASCMSSDGYFFDLPRPGEGSKRQFPLTYNLKFLFLLTLCSRYSEDPRLQNRLRRGFESTLPLFTAGGDCSYFGRTDRTTFSAGLSVFCLRAAAYMGLGGQGTYDLVKRAEESFLLFPTGGDGCLEVNRYPLPASIEDLKRSRDVYAFRWQYAIAGAAYFLVAQHLFPLSSSVCQSEGGTVGPTVFSADALGITRLRVGDLDLFVQTDCCLSARDRRHLGPTILRLEKGPHTIVGTIPIRTSFDSAYLRASQRTSRLARHWGLIRHRWRLGYEALHAELAGFVPVLRRGNRAWLPCAAFELQADANRLVSLHRFRTVYASGWRPVWYHLMDLARRNAPPMLESFLREPPLSAGEVDIQLTRTIEVIESSVVISDSIEGELDGMNLVIGDRTMGQGSIECEGLVAGRALRGWSSDGPQEIQLYRTECLRKHCQYEISIHTGYGSLETGRTH